MNFKFDELSLENIGAWPNVVKATLIVVGIILILFLGYWFDISSQIEDLHKAQKDEGTLFNTLKINQHQTANFEFYKQQLEQINQIFKKILQHLPTKSEIPGLLEDISKTGVANGLEFKLFKPSPEVQHSFYTELTIEIIVVGNYHQLAEFISEIASLDRIVTLHDFSITPIKADPNQQNKGGQQKSGLLELSLTAKTYRYTGEPVNTQNDQKQIGASNLIRVKQ